MYLKSLEIHGFKSFPIRTVLNFEPGTTVIVGPNGSGKSNISDAMRYVLGEVSMKNVRAKDMDEIIFGGTETRKRMGFAEVTVVFDNTDPNYRLDSPYDEVSVTRRYFRGSTTDYLINGQLCTRKEVHQLFYNTGVGRDGYSIVGQGKVAELISQKSEERRNVFEEAAGIASFKHDRHDAELNLATTERNMEITSIQIEAYTSRLEPLRIEAERAKRGAQILAEKKEVDVALWLYDTAKVHTDLEQARILFAQLGDDVHALEAKINALYEEQSELEQRRDRAQIDSEDFQQRIESIQKQRAEIKEKVGYITAQITECRKQIATLEGELISAKRQLQRVEDNIAQEQSKIDAIQRDIDELKAKKLELLAEQQSIQIRLKELDSEHVAAEKEEQQLTESYNALRIDFSLAEQALESSLTYVEQAKQELEALKEERETLLHDFEQCEKNANGFKKQLDEAKATLVSLEQKLETLKQKKESLQAKLGELSVDYQLKEKRSADIQAMIDQMEGFSRTVKIIMNDYQAGKIYRVGTIYGPLSTLLKVEGKYSLAIDTALGASAQHIVTDTDETAKSAIEYLHATKSGKATFLPINTMRSATETPEIREAQKLPGFIKRADQLVQCDGKFRSIVEHLLLRTLIFDTLDHATAAHRKMQGKVRLVTLEGDIMNVGGSMTGGSSKNEGTSVLSRSTQIEQLAKEMLQIQKDIDRLNSEIQNSNAQIEQTQKDITSQKGNIEYLDEMFHTAYSSYDHASTSLENCDMDMQEIENKIASNDEIQRLNQEDVKSKEAALHQLETRLSTCKKQQEHFIEQQQEQRQLLEELAAEIQQFDLQITARQGNIQGVQISIDRLNEQLEERQETYDNTQKALSKREEDLQSYDRQNAELVQAQEDLDQEQSTSASGRESSRENFDNLVKQINKVQQELKMYQSKKESLNREYYEAEANFNNLTKHQEELSSQLYETWGMSYDDAIAAGYPEATAENEHEFRQKSISCQNRLKNNGYYNASAIEDFNKLNAEFEELNVQYQDLIESQKHFIKIIAELNERMAKTFIDAFNQINENFGMTFRELFGGGNAHLELSDPEDILNSGIDIMVAPPGKKIASLMLLSGGEQSLVSIALFFAIMKLHPTPFCILDEVEAALDDVNVDRVGNYIKKIAAKTQFICISHRRGTMQIADRLFGVSMHERGVTQIIRVDVEDIAKCADQYTYEDKKN